MLNLFKKKKVVSAETPLIDQHRPDTLHTATFALG